MKIHIIGSAGSGKTTLARQLAENLACPHIELDSLQWVRNWQRTPVDQLREKVYRSLQSERWVIDGDYETIRNLIWFRVKKVVWLDYSALLIGWRLARRGVQYAISQKRLWGTECRESWRSLFSCQSLFVRAITAHAKWQAKYEALSHRSEFSHIEFIRLPSPGATAQWAESICQLNCG